MNGDSLVSLIKPIDEVEYLGPDKTPKPNGGWTTQYELNEKGEINWLILKSDFGAMLFGKFEDGHIGWRWFEQGGGGAVTVFFTITPENQIYVGLREEVRRNMGTDASVRRLCVVGGFKDPGETAQQAQAREAGEEVGIDAVHQGDGLSGESR